MSATRHHDLFQPDPGFLKVLRLEEAFGRADGRRWQPLCNGYSLELNANRFAAYERGWRSYAPPELPACT